MTVRIDERGDDGLAAKIDDLRSGGCFDRAACADGGDAPVLDDKRGVVNGWPALSSEESRAFEHKRARLCSRQPRCDSHEAGGQQHSAHRAVILLGFVMRRTLGW